MNSKVKKKQIIIELFGYITRTMIKKNISNPLEVRISLSAFEKYINEKLGADINSVQHIYQQIRAYERSQHIRLFKKKPSPKDATKDDIIISLVNYSGFRDKLFLHVGLKMDIARGAYDLIEHLYEGSNRPLNIYLSAGSESYYFAQYLFQSSDRELNLYTHNLGIIENYINHYQHLSNIRIHTRFGTVSCNELAVFESAVDNYAQTYFDAIIASTTFIDKGGLYIESENEIKYKREIFQLMKGVRILLLTLLEYNYKENTAVAKHHYAEVKDFDYIVIPSEKLVPQYRNLLTSLSLKTMIKYYNYEVLNNEEKKSPIKEKS